MATNVAPQTSAPAYKTVPADLRSDQPRITALWRRNSLQPQEVDAKYQWLYLDNPYPAPRQLLLHAGSQVAGAAGMITRKFTAAGTELSAGLLTDLFVLPEHRTVLPALTLQRQMRTLGLAQHDFLYGYPNDKSLPIVRRIGHAQIGEMGKWVALLRYGAYLERWLPRWLARPTAAVAERVVPWQFRPHHLFVRRWHGEWLTAADERFDALWERARQADTIIGVRDRRFLSWRFFARPSHQYRLFALTHEPRGALAAYAVCESLGDTLHIRDLLIDPGSTDPLRVLVHLLSQHAYREGFVRLSLEFLGGQALGKALRSAGMFQRSSTVLIGSLSAKAQAALEGRDWYITAADTET